MRGQGWRPVALGLVVVALGCGAAPGNAGAPGASAPMEVGASAPYRLYTHCGVVSASINGRTCFAEPPLADGAGNPPSGWGNPYDDGEMTLPSATAADFGDPAGHTAQFTSRPRGPTPSIPICS